MEHIIALKEELEEDETYLSTVRPTWAATLPTASPRAIVLMAESMRDTLLRAEADGRAVAAAAGRPARRAASVGAKARGAAFGETRGGGPLPSTEPPTSTPPSRAAGPMPSTAPHVKAEDQQAAATSSGTAHDAVT